MKNGEREERYSRLRWSRIRKLTDQEDDQRGDDQDDQQHHDTKSLLLVGCYQLVLHNLPENKSVIMMPQRSQDDVKMMHQKSQEDVKMMPGNSQDDAPEKSTLAVVHSHYPQPKVGEDLPQVLRVVECRLGRRVNRLQTCCLPGNSGEPGRGRALAPSGPGCCLWSNHSLSVLDTFVFEMVAEAKIIVSKVFLVKARSQV